MRVLIITVAGMSSRFSESLGKPVIKCLYNNDSIKNSLLYMLLKQSETVDKFIIVGGYRYAELEYVIKNEFSEFADRIVLLENENYQSYGSGYSLYVGLKYAIDINADEIVFAEGDLFIDSDIYRSVCNASKSVITVNHDPILANKAVVLYLDETMKVHYLYDTNHNTLCIDKPFRAVYNSGQIWKFSDSMIVKNLFREISEEEWSGTNLVFVERYFQAAGSSNYEILTFNRWINCNTVDDYNRIFEK